MLQALLFHLPQAIPGHFEKDCNASWSGSQSCATSAGISNVSTLLTQHPLTNPPGFASQPSAPSLQAWLALGQSGYPPQSSQPQPDTHNSGGQLVGTKLSRTSHIAPDDWVASKDRATTALNAWSQAAASFWVQVVSLARQQCNGWLSLSPAEHATHFGLPTILVRLSSFNFRFWKQLHTLNCSAGLSQIESSHLPCRKARPPYWISFFWPSKKDNPPSSQQGSPGSKQTAAGKPHQNPDIHKLSSPITPGGTYWADGVSTSLGWIDASDTRLSWRHGRRNSPDLQWGSLCWWLWAQAEGWARGSFWKEWLTSPWRFCAWTSSFFISCSSNLLRALRRLLRIAYPQIRDCMLPRWQASALMNWRSVWRWRWMTQFLTWPNQASKVLSYCTQVCALPLPLWASSAPSPLALEMHRKLSPPTILWWLSLRGSIASI